MQSVYQCIALADETVPSRGDGDLSFGPVVSLPIHAMSTWPAMPLVQHGVS